MTFLQRIFLFHLLLIFSLAAPAHSQDPGRAMIVFDGSGSMWGQIDGTAKIVTARATLSRVVTQLPADLEVGLIAYGHNRKGDCRDIETLVPVGPVSARASQLVASVEGLKPKGKTPLTDAVRRAAAELRYQEDKATVILVTDGIETCKADPCAVANELESLGIDFTTHVIGFGLSAEEGRQVACLAENTGGQYLEAANSDDLANALQQTVALTPPPALLEPKAPASVQKNLSASVSLVEDGPALTDADGIRVFWSATPLDGGPELTLLALPQIKERLDPGTYRLVAKTDRGSSAATEVTLTDTKMTEVRLALGAGKLDLFAVMVNPDLELYNTDFHWEIENTVTGESFTKYTRNLEMVIPSGRYRAKLVLTRLDKMSPGTIEVDVVTGETASAEIIAASSKVLFRAFTAEGSELTRHDVRFEIFQGASTEDTSARVAGRIGGDAILLLPGQYAVRAEDWSGDKRDPATEVVTVEPGAIQTFDLKFQ